MDLRAPALVCSTRSHGETAVIVRLMTEERGLIAAYVAGGRGRQLRPILVPGNLVAADIRARAETQLPFASLELITSRGPWLTEPLAAAAIQWVTVLTASALAERQPHASLFEALSATLDAVCLAPSARGWLPALVGFEALLLRELGYGVPVARPDPADWDALLDAFDRIGRQLRRYPLAESRGDVMAARAMLRDRLGRIHGAA